MLKFNANDLRDINSFGFHTRFLKPPFIRASLFGLNELNVEDGSKPYTNDKWTNYEHYFILIQEKRENSIIDKDIIPLTEITKESAIKLNSEIDLQKGLNLKPSLNVFKDLIQETK